MADPINVAIIGKNQREEVRIMLDTFKGAQLVDMRVFSAFTSNNIMMPTKKGLSPVSYTHLTLPTTPYV